MDTTSLYKAFKEKKWVDLELVLEDGSNKLILNVHKILMIYFVPFFAKLLFFGPDLSTYTLQVPDVAVVHDLIMSFYGQTVNTTSYGKWYYALLMAKCRDYFGLDISMPAITVDIDKSEYDEFLELSGMVGIDDELAKIITKNLPKDYDLGKLSPKMIQVMIDSGKSYAATILNNNCIEIFDIKNGSCLIPKIITSSFVYQRLVSSDYKYIVVIEGGKCSIWNGFSGRLYFKYDKSCVDRCIFTPDGLSLIIVIAEFFLKIICLADLSIEYYFQNDIEESIINQYFSPNGKYLVLQLLDNNLRVLDYEINQEPTTGYIIENPYGMVSFSPNSRFIVTHSKNSNTQYKIWDLEKKSFKDFNSLVPPGHLTEISFLQHPKKSPIDNEYIAFRYDGLIQIYDFDEYSLVNMIDACQSYRIIFSPDNKLVAIINMNSVDVYDINGSKPLQQFSAYNHVVFSPNNEYIAMAQSKYVRIVDLSSGKTIFNLDIDVIRDLLEFSSDSKLFTFMTQNYVYTYDIATGSVLSQIYGQKNEPIGVYYDEASRRLMDYVLEQKN